MKISLIIPTYNEAKNIKEIIREAKTYLQDFEHEIIVVDDNSPDKTSLIALNEDVIVINRYNKKGLSSAILEGFEHSNGDIIGVIDADLSHPPNKLPELIRAVNKCDLVIGSRLVEGGKVEEWTLIRRTISYIARLLAKPLTPVKDIMSGFFFIKKSVIQGVDITPRGYKLLLDIIIKGNYQSYKEIPITFRNRKLGQSKLNLKIQLEYLKQLISLYKYKWFK